MSITLSNVIEYLKSPHLVIKVQKYFGVKYCNLEYNNLSNDIHNQHINESSEHLNTPNGSRRSNSSSNSSNSSKSSSKSGENGHINRRHHENGDVRPKTSDESETDTSPSLNHTDTEHTKRKFIIDNKFWYYLFVLGTALGDEIFYATFIPFWFWNIDTAVGRRVVFVWSSVMYVGQGFKDIIRWERPGPPVQRLQKKWALEYGMPSTHAMVAVSIPFSVLIYTYERYQYSLIYGLIIATLWCTLICVSRLYLGMHSVLDIIAGLTLTVLLMIPLIPLVDYLDRLILESLYSPLFVIAISILMIVFYPDSGRWTPTRGDTTLTVSVTAGIQIGAWIAYQTGHIVPPMSPPPYEIIWPSHVMLGSMILRTVLGLCVIVATRAIGKSISYAFVCALLGRDKNELRNSENTLENKHKIIVELSYKYFTCAMIGLSTQFLLPNFFRMLGIGRPDFYTEY